MKPITRLLFALITAALICQAVYIICRKGLDRYNIHKVDRLSEIFLNNTSYDFIFIGSSRTHTSINPLIIDSVCRVNSYNAGVEGGNIYEFKLTLDGFLVSHPVPKCLVLTLDLYSFDLTRKIFNHVQYFPFIKNHIVKDKLKETGHYSAVYKFFPFLQLTALDDYSRGNVVKGLTGHNEIPRGEIQYKGYLTNTLQQIQTNIRTLPTNKALVFEQGVGLLKSIIDTCRVKNIQLIFTYAPEYLQNLQKSFSNAESVFKLINGISVANNIPYLRDDRLDICHDPRFFANAGHLNRIGADVYSRLLGAELNVIIK